MPCLASCPGPWTAEAGTEGEDLEELKQRKRWLRDELKRAEKEFQVCFYALSCYKYSSMLNTQLTAPTHLLGLSWNFYLFFATMTTLVLSPDCSQNYSLDKLLPGFLLKKSGHPGRLFSTMPLLIFTLHNFHIHSIRCHEYLDWNVLRMGSNKTECSHNLLDCDLSEIAFRCFKSTSVRF